MKHSKIISTNNKFIKTIAGLPVVVIKRTFSTSPGLLVLLSLLLLDSVNLYCQNTVISAGTRVIGTGGRHVLKSNLINNGSFQNNNNEIVFSGSVQSLAGSVPVGFENLSVESGSVTTINTPGQTVNSILLCDGTLNANGNLTLLSTLTGTALIDGTGNGQILGNITMQRYLPSGFGNKYFSSPFQNATVAEFSDEINLLASFPALYTYNESLTSSGWVSYINPANLLIPLQGYSINFGSSQVPVTADMTGIVNNGALNSTFNNHNYTYTAGFNLTGNPYPSPIDWDALAGWTNTNIDNSLYFFRADAADQYGGVYSTYLNGISSDGLATNIIPSMQGFFIHVSDGSYPVTASLELTNSVRVNDHTHSFIKSGEKASQSFVRLVAGYSDDTLSFDPLCIYLDEKATYDFDGYYDALKLFNTDRNVTNFYCFGNDGSRLSIDALPLNDSLSSTVRLGLKTERSGEVIFRIPYLGNDFHYKNINITDVYSGNSQDLLSDKQYRVELPAGDYQDRFFLNLDNITTAVPEVIPDDGWFKIWASPGNLRVEINLPGFDNGTLKIYNLMGGVLNIYKIYQPGYHEFSPKISSGIYIVTFVSGNRVISKKVYFAKI